MTYDHMTAHMTPDRFAELLERNSTTWDEVAKLVDVSPTTLEAIQKGNYDPPLSLAYKLAAALNVSVEKLYSD